MAITSTVAVTVDVNGDGQVSGPESIGVVANPASPASLQQYQLVLGNIALVLPLGFAVNYLMIDANTTTSGQTLTIKGNSGDVGVTLSSLMPSLIPVSNVNPFNEIAFDLTANVAVYAPVGQVWLEATGPGLLGVGWF
jgi:hypothetical protein